MQTTSPCPSTRVDVKIITPKEIADNPPPGFHTLMDRYPSLSSVGALPDSDLPTVLHRFQRFSSMLSGDPEKKFSNVLLCDLDVIFQRNLFALSQIMSNGVELLLFAEWRASK